MLVEDREEVSSGHVEPMLHQCVTQHYAALQSQKAVSAYFTSKQILPSGFAEQYKYPHYRVLVSKDNALSDWLTDYFHLICHIVIDNWAQMFT